MKKLVVVLLSFLVLSVVSILLLFQLTVQHPAESVSVYFEYEPSDYEAVTSVYLTGLMNSWKYNDPHYQFQKSQDGKFIFVTNMDVGKYLCKLIINDQWVNDMKDLGSRFEPQPIDYIDDSFGGRNALIKVGESPKPSVFGHWIILYHIVCFMIGFTALFLFTILYFRYKNLDLRNYILLMIPVNFILFIIIFSIYKIAIIDNYVIVKYSFFFVDTYNERLFLNWLFHLSAGVLVFTLPQFFHQFLEKPLSSLQKALFTFIGAIVAIIPIYHYILRLDRTLSQTVYEINLIAINGLFFVLLGYILFFVLRNYQKTVHQEKRIILSVMLGLIVFYMPFYLLDTFWQELQMGRKLIPFGLDFFTMFYGLWNIGSIVFVARFFMKADNLAAVEKGEVSSHLLEDMVKRFDITDREKEIIIMLCQGLSSKDISSKLFISPKTVNNHIYNIYHKVGVKNRIELSNLFWQPKSTPNH